MSWVSSQGIFPRLYSFIFVFFDVRQNPFLDRLRSVNEIVDFVDIGFWPIFNVADLSIVCGVAILAYHLWNEEDRPDRPDRLPCFSEEGNL